MTLATTVYSSENKFDVEEDFEVLLEIKCPEAPIQPDQEWANALTHGLAAFAGIVGAGVMAWQTADAPVGTTLSCLAFTCSAIAVFVASTLSHTHVFFDNPERLRRLRAWDQGLIYAMISGTYTPLIYQFADSQVRNAVLVAIWVAAAIGFYSKVFVGHRVNSIGTVTYLSLGWLPALALVGRVPTGVLIWMSAGGVIYTLGVVVLLNDSRLRYLHCLWHLLVITAAGCHYWAIFRYIAVPFAETT